MVYANNDLVVIAENKEDLIDFLGKVNSNLSDSCRSTSRIQIITAYSSDWDKQVSFSIGQNVKKCSN